MRRTGNWTLVDTKGQTPPRPFSAFDRRAIPNDASESQWIAGDGWPIRRIDWPVSNDARGSILFLPGRGDFYEKYLETLDWFAGKGFAVTALDWRGQALSGRMIAGVNLGHIDDFGIWTADLAEFFTAWKASTPAPHIIVAHSMGGHIATRAVGDGVIVPDALILSAPMLSVKGAALPDGFSHGFARLIARLRGPHSAAWRTSEKPGATLRARQAMLTHDDARYADEQYWIAARPGLHLGPGTWGWVRAAYASIRHIAAAGFVERITCPVHIFATDGDQLVGTPRIRQLAARMPDCDLFVAPKSVGHEMLREIDAVRDDVLARMDRFLYRVAPETP